MRRQVAHSAAVVAPRNLSDKGLQPISSSLYNNSQSIVPVPKKNSVV